MTSAVIKLQASTPATHRSSTTAKLAGAPLQPKFLRFPRRKFTVISLQSTEDAALTSPEAPSISPQLTTSVGSPSLHLTLSPRHITVLNVAACAVAISATWLFCSAIPTLLAFKRAAESLEKLLDVTREELPDTMAAVRLSGMEISDLTMELSDLGQEITSGVKRSTSAVRMAEEKLRQFASMTSRAPMQEGIRRISSKPATAEPAIAKNARGIREKIVKGRTTLSMIFAVTRFSQSFFSYFSKRSKSQKMLNK